jgi:hypothetical protein
MNKSGRFAPAEQLAGDQGKKVVFATCFSLPLRRKSQI